ncbi:BamA/TamA family outer membrane protein [Maribacter algicola]|uniref:BamA/TamA family outer membrane protein n=1 Tax=Meishania litoralis TaxID=3434685 RepID=A0ACC7LLR4_9FLAO
MAKISLLLLAVAISSCNTLRRVEDDESLIVKNTVFVDDEKVNNEEIESLIIQEPNSSLLGYPLRLNLYNLAKVNPDSSFQAWLYRKQKRKQRLVDLLSEKQVNRLGESFLVKGMSEWLKNIGEAPVILDTSATRKTLQRLSAYYSGKGYFNNSTTYEIVGKKRKQRVGVAYKINLGQPYFIDSITHDISSKAIDSLYFAHSEASLISKGKQFNSLDFALERERLTAIFKNSGVYNFQESSIGFEILRDSTAKGVDKELDVLLQIDDLRARQENVLTTSEYKVHKFDKVNIYTDFLFDERDGELKFERFGDYTIFYRNKLRFKPKTLTDAIFFEKDSIYREIDRIRTYRQITNLNVFKYPSIVIEEDSTNTDLTANIYLSARPKYSSGSEFNVTRSNFQQIGMGLTQSLQARNLFRGAENLSLSGRVNLGASKDPIIDDNRFFNILEWGVDLSLNFPRIWFPFIKTDKIIANYMLPQTRVTLGTTSQRNIGLDKRTFNTIFGYNWAPSDFRRHSLELLNVQFVKNLNPDRFFNVYTSAYNQLNDIATNPVKNYIGNPLVSDFYTFDDDGNASLLLPDDDPDTPDGTAGFIKAVKNQGLIPTSDEDYIDVVRIEERRERLTENNLIFASNYTLNTNNRNGLTDNSFYRFRWKLESAGNLLSGLSYLIPFDQENDKLLVFNVPYSQYIKTEFDYVKYWDLRRSNVLAFHSFLGIAVPYGNSDNIPFVRSYFAGGSNDNRAWYPYSLGPGKTRAINNFNEANLKLAFNLEYRFPVVGDINGALFADAGNIWNVFDNVDDPDATFNGIGSLADIALGTGFGLRYDFTYFLFRVDLGFKTYNPAEEQSKRWFRTYNFSNSVLQIGINYPF